MPLSPFRQKWLQMFPGFHKSPHPPPLPSPPSHQGRCSVTWIPQNLQGRLHKYSSGLEPKRTLLIICLTCISYQSWYFSFASFPTLTWMSFMFVNVVKSLWLFIKVKYSDYDALLLFSRLCYFRPCMRWFECLLRVFSVCLV